VLDVLVFQKQERLEAQTAIRATAVSSIRSCHLVGVAVNQFVVW